MKIAIATALMLAISLGSCSPRLSDKTYQATKEAKSIEDARQAMESMFSSAKEVRLFVFKKYVDGRPVYTSSKGRILTGDQRHVLETTLSVGPMPEMVAACFIPHHFFRYYDASGHQIGEVAVCFCCQGVEITGAYLDPYRSKVEFKADYHALKGLVRSLSEPVDINCD